MSTGKAQIYFCIYIFKTSGLEYKIFAIKTLCMNSKAWQRQKPKCVLTVTVGWLGTSYTVEAGQRR